MQEVYFRIGDLRDEVYRQQDDVIYTLKYIYHTARPIRIRDHKHMTPRLRGERSAFFCLKTIDLLSLGEGRGDKKMRNFTGRHMFMTPNTIIC